MYGSIYAHFWLVCTTRAAKASTGSLVRPPQPVSLPIFAGDVQAPVDCMGTGELHFCDVQLGDLLSGLMHWGSVQYIPLKTGFVRQMLAPYSSYSAFVWQAS